MRAARIAADAYRHTKDRDEQIEVALRLFVPGELAGSGQTYALRRARLVVDNRQGSQLWRGVGWREGHRHFATLVRLEDLFALRL